MRSTYPHQPVAQAEQRQYLNDSEFVPRPAVWTGLSERCDCFVPRQGFRPLAQGWPPQARLPWDELGATADATPLG
jgi:hypothetical protein